MSLLFANLGQISIENLSRDFLQLLHLHSKECPRGDLNPHDLAVNGF